MTTLHYCQMLTAMKPLDRIFKANYLLELYGQENERYLQCYYRDKASGILLRFGRELTAAENCNSIRTVELTEARPSISVVNLSFRVLFESGDLHIVGKIYVGGLPLEESDQKDTLILSRIKRLEAIGSISFTVLEREDHAGLFVLTTPKGAEESYRLIGNDSSVFIPLFETPYYRYLIKNSAVIFEVRAILPGESEPSSWYEVREHWESRIRIDNRKGDLLIENIWPFYAESKLGVYYQIGDTFYIQTLDSLTLDQTEPPNLVCIEGRKREDLLRVFIGEGWIVEACRRPNAPLSEQGEAPKRISLSIIVNSPDHTGWVHLIEESEFQQLSDIKVQLSDAPNDRCMMILSLIGEGQVKNEIEEWIVNPDDDPSYLYVLRIRVSESPIQPRFPVVSFADHGPTVRVAEPGRIIEYGALLPGGETETPRVIKTLEDGVELGRQFFPDSVSLIDHEDKACYLDAAGELVLYDERKIEPYMIDSDVGVIGPIFNMVIECPQDRNRSETYESILSLMEQIRRIDAEYYLDFRVFYPESDYIISSGQGVCRQCSTEAMDTFQERYLTGGRMIHFNQTFGSESPERAYQLGMMLRVCFVHVNLPHLPISFYKLLQTKNPRYYDEDLLHFASIHSPETLHLAREMYLKPEKVEQAGFESLEEALRVFCEIDLDVPYLENIRQMAEGFLGDVKPKWLVKNLGSIAATISGQFEKRLESFNFAFESANHSEWKELIYQAILNLDQEEQRRVFINWSGGPQCPGHSYSIRIVDDGKPIQVEFLTCTRTIVFREEYLSDIDDVITVMLQPVSVFNSH